MPILTCRFTTGSYFKRELKEFEQEVKNFEQEVRTIYKIANSLRRFATFFRGFVKEFFKIAKVTGKSRMSSKLKILDLQPISWNTPDNISRPRWFVPTIELIKYSFVLHHQHGRPAIQEKKRIASFGFKILFLLVVKLRHVYS